MDAIFNAIGFVVLSGSLTFGAIDAIISGVVNDPNGAPNLSWMHRAACGMARLRITGLVTSCLGITDLLAENP